MEEKKKLLILLDTDDYKKIEIFKRFFLQDNITLIPKGVCEIWEVDELNNIRQIF